MYDTPDDLLREILAGEDSFLDFKEGPSDHDPHRSDGGARSPAAALAKDLCCFANTAGGVIVFGVRDDGERLGIPKSEVAALQQLVVNVAQNGVEPPLPHLLLLDRVLIPDSQGTPRLCLKVEIRKARFSVHAPRGKRPYIRVGDHCVEASLEQQARLFERRGMMMPFEERPVHRAPIEALDRDRLAAYYERRFEGKLEAAALGYERLLENLKLAAHDEAGVLHPTALGLLLFSKHPEEHLRGALVDIAVYAGEHADAGEQRDAKVIAGPLPEQIGRVLEYLQTSPLLPIAATKDGIGRTDFPAYSLRALQEGVVNALVHRDYAITGAQTRVFLFPDRIEISNPGALPNTLSRDDLYAGCQPVRRNQMLAGFLRDYVSPITLRSYMEGRGEGFLTMVRECERRSGRKPDLAVIGESVRLTVWAAPAPVRSPA